MSSPSNNGSVLAGFAAETLLGPDAHVIKEIHALRDDLRYNTKGSEVSLDDSFIRLQQEVDALPRIVLDMDVPPGTENEYLIRLSTAQEKVLDDCDRVLRRTLEFQSKLKNAERAVKKYKADFMAWYILSAAYVVKSHDVKFSAPQIKQLAEAEFSRLISNLDVQIDNLINSVEHLVEEVRQHKKIQSEKHSLGKDQANASWTSKMANPNGIAPNRADDMAQIPDDEVEEEEDENIPAFVSKRPQVSEPERAPASALEAAARQEPVIVNSNQDLLDGAKPGDTITLRFHDKLRSIVTDKMRVTGPVTLPLITAPEDVAAFLSDEPEVDSVKHYPDGSSYDFATSRSTPPKFRVHGETDPKFATPWELPSADISDSKPTCVGYTAAVETVREILADPDPDRKFEFRGPVAGCETVVSSSTTTMKPRKRLILTEDEDLM